MRNFKASVFGTILAAGLLIGCEQEAPTSQEKSKQVVEQSGAGIRVPFEKYTLDNGLTVIMHVDRSDPVVSVALTSHVGSAREIAGRTGFAHMFEHLLFLESENLGKGGLDKMSARIGGSGANGSTSRDRTNYFQTVPKDALEKMIWAEADKLGWFINTVTEQVLAKEKQVVKNEKRQSYDNRPYGHTQYVIDKNLYPEDHPYNWQVIGSLEDLQNATLDDVKNFFNQWYVPNNVSLTIAGDFDKDQAKEWVSKYFAEIKAGQHIPVLEKRMISLAESKSLYHEDNFARSGELRLTWPTVPKYHPDSYALDMFVSLFSDGKKSPLNSALVDELKLSSNVGMYDYMSEISGAHTLYARAFKGKSLDEVKAGIDKAFLKFETDGISKADLDRIKAVQETSFYNQISSVLSKAFYLAEYDMFAGGAEALEKDIEKIQVVTVDDINRVYAQYIKGKPFVATSFVPKGQTELALSGSVKAEVAEEKIIKGAEEKFDPSQQAAFIKTPSLIDRSEEPPYGDEPQLNIPTIWQEELGNGLKLYGIENTETPLVAFEIVMDGGLMLDSPDKVGVAYLLSEILMKGTVHKTTIELQDAIKSLGAGISVSVGDDSIVLSGTTLSRTFDETIALASEILLEPRWDANEFDLLKLDVDNQLQQQGSNPQAIASLEFAKLIYGKDHMLSKNILGDQASLKAITMADLKDYYQNKLSPSNARFHIVGDVDKAKVISSLKTVNAKWLSQTVEMPSYSLPMALTASKVYFYDVPGAKQSVLRIGYLGLSRTDKDFYPVNVMNYILGGGGFASRLTQQLREGKGYTYGIRSRFAGTDIPGPFALSSNIRSNVTLEAIELIKTILADYNSTYTQEDHAVAQNFLIKSKSRSFETLSAKLSMLSAISRYNLPYDYARKQQEVVKSMDVAAVQALAKKYIDPDRMIFLVVGDAETQLSRLAKLGYGEPILLNEKKPAK